MFARVAQWWSIALPRRGSRVRIPSRALNDTKKEISVGYLLFCMFEPCRVRTVRMSTLRSGRRRRTSPGRSATSRALKEIEKESSDGWLFFLCSSPAGFERFECLRSTPVVAGERPPDVLRRLVLSIRCEKEEISDGYLLFFSHVRALPGSSGSKSTLRCGRRNNFKCL